MLLIAAMYCSSIGVPHMYLASLDVGTAKAVYVHSPILRDKIPTQRKPPTCKKKELHPGIQPIIKYPLDIRFPQQIVHLCIYKILEKELEIQHVGYFLVFSEVIMEFIHCGKVLLLSGSFDGLYCSHVEKVLSRIQKAGDLA